MAGYFVYIDKETNKVCTTLTWDLDIVQQHYEGVTFKDLKSANTFAIGLLYMRTQKDSSEANAKSLAFYVKRYLELEEVNWNFMQLKPSESIKP